MSTLRKRAACVLSLTVGLSGLLASTAACSSSSEAAPAEAPALPTEPTASPVDAPSPSQDERCAVEKALVEKILRGLRESPVLSLAVSTDTCRTQVSVVADGAPPPGDALYRVGSVTKTFVSATMLVLEREGKLSLSDKVSKYVEGLPVLESITLEQLLKHTSGLFNFTEDPDFVTLRTMKRSPREIVETALMTPPYFEPGMGWHYSNTNFTLLGMVIEKATGQKVSAAIRTRVLGPAKLTRTFFDGEETLPEPLVPGFSTRSRDVTHVEDLSEPWAAGAMVASIGDVASYHHALFGGGLLDAASQAKLVANPAPVNGSRVRYGLGVFILDKKETLGLGPALGHGGDIDGFHTESLHFLDHRTTISAVANQDGVDPTKVVIAVAKALFAK